MNISLIFSHGGGGRGKLRNYRVMDEFFSPKATTRIGIPIRPCAYEADGNGIRFRKTSLL